MKLASICIDDQMEPCDASVLLASSLESDMDMTNESMPALLNAELAGLAALHGARTRQQFGVALNDIVRVLGFQYYYIETFWVSPTGHPIRDTYSTFPPLSSKPRHRDDEQEHEGRLAKSFPKNKSLYWDGVEHMQPGTQAIYQFARERGIQSGVSVNVQPQGGSYTMVTLSLKNDSKGISQPARDAFKKSTAVLACMVHAIAGRFGRSGARLEDVPKLTAREIECMEWVAAGKTAWELANIIGVTEATAVFHMKNVIRKLNASNRQHALAIAFHHGILK